MSDKTFGMFLALGLPFLVGFLIAIFATRVKHKSQYQIGTDGERILIHFQAASFPTLWRTYGLVLAFYWLLIPLGYAVIVTITNLSIRAFTKRRGSAEIEIANGKITSRLLRGNSDPIVIDIPKIHRFVLRNPISKQESSASMMAFAVPVGGGVSGGIASGMTAAAAGAASIGAGFAQNQGRMFEEACWQVDAEGGGKTYTLACGMDEETGSSLLKDIHHAVDVFQSAAASPAGTVLLKNAYPPIGEAGEPEGSRDSGKMLFKLVLAAALVFGVLYFFFSIES